MNPDQPLGQPITPQSTDPQYVPQPLGSKSPKINKKWWLIITGAVGLVLILGGLYWVLAKNAKSSYDKAVVTYKQQIKEVRDSMNKKLDDNDISVYSAEAPPVFEEYGKKLQDVIAKEPKAPKVLRFIPAGKANSEVAPLTAATKNYANQLRHINELYEYYIGIADAFKPIHEVGTFTVFQADTIKNLPGMYETFLTKLKAMTPPAGLDSFQADLISQTEVLITKFKELADGFNQRTIGQNDDQIGTLKEPTQTFNDTFQKNAADTSNEAIDKVNTYYDALDALLK